MPFFDKEKFLQAKKIKEYSKKMRAEKKKTAYKRRKREGLSPEKRSPSDKLAGNQFKADPRQELFLKMYQNPVSPTFANAKQSALKAGYSENYSNGILTFGKNWILSLKNQKRRERMLDVSEANLENFLSGKEKTIEDRKLKLNATVFTLKTLGKDVYSERNVDDVKEVRHVLDVSQAERILQRRIIQAKPKKAQIEPIP